MQYPGPLTPKIIDILAIAVSVKQNPVKVRNVSLKAGSG